MGEKEQNARVSLLTASEGQTTRVYDTFSIIVKSTCNSWNMWELHCCYGATLSVEKDRSVNDVRWKRGT